MQHTLQNALAGTLQSWRAPRKPGVSLSDAAWGLEGGWVAHYLS
jgi:hypothetical protein